MRIELEYDPSVHQYSFSYHSDASDNVRPIHFGPFDYTGPIAEYQTFQFQIGVGGALSYSNGLLNYLSVLPTDASPGDFTGEAVLDFDDLNMLERATHVERVDGLFDVTRNGTVDNNDVTYWVRSLRHSYIGDANLDGAFDSRDLVNVFQAGQYEDANTGTSHWATGDWNTDGDFTTSDIVLAFQDGGYEQGPRVEVASVPEPCGIEFLLFGCVLLRIRSSRYRNNTSGTASTHWIL